MNGTTNVPLFEVIGFESNPTNEITLENGTKMFDCKKIQKENTKVVDVAKKLCVCEEGKEEQLKIGVNDAALFSAYFGVPKKSSEKDRWEKSTLAEKVVIVSNKIMQTPYRSFTKIL
jgi:hypothetical protein